MPNEQLRNRQGLPMGCARLVIWAAAVAAMPLHSGCINVMAIAGKVLLGDPVVTPPFEQQTGVNLADGHRAALICTAPASLTSDFDALHLDVQDEVIRRMRVRGLDVADSGTVIDALDSAGGRFNPDVLAEGLPDVDYVLHVEIGHFSPYVEASPHLYRGRARGVVLGYRVVRGDGVPIRTIPVFEHHFRVEYPSSHSVASDEMSLSVFVRKCVDEISDTVGQSLYDIRTSELY